MFEIIREMSFDISFILLAISALILYFGKLIADTRVEIYDRLSLYITGLIFTVAFVFLPFLISYAIYEKFLIDLIYIYPIELMIISLLSVNLFFQEYFYRFGWTEVFKKNMNRGLDKIKEKKSKKGKLVNKYEKIFKNNIGFGYVELYFKAFRFCQNLFKNKYILLLTSIIILYTILLSIETGDFITISLIGITSFFGFSMLAIVYGFRKAYYPKAVIILNDNEKLTGRIQKFDEYLYILDDEKDEKLFINKDKIKYIVESKSKSKIPIR